MLIPQQVFMSKSLSSNGSNVETLQKVKAPIAGQQL